MWFLFFSNLSFPDFVIVVILCCYYIMLCWSLWLLIDLLALSEEKRSTFWKINVSEKRFAFYNTATKKQHSLITRLRNSVVDQ